MTKSTPYLLILLCSTLVACASRGPTRPANPVEVATSTLRGEAGCRQMMGRSYASTEERLAAIFHFLWDDGVLDSPEGATFLGDARGQNLLTDYSLPAIERRKKLTLCSRELLLTVDRNRLEKASDKLNYDLFLRGLDEGIEGQKFPSEYLVVDQMGGPHQGFPQLLLAMRTGSLKDYNDRLERLERAPEWVSQFIRLLQEGLTRGITPPRTTLKSLPKQIDQILEPDPAKNPIMRAFDDMPSSIAKEDQEKVRARAVDLLRKKVIPAFKTYREYVAGPYLAGARDSIAFSLMPDGIEWYAFLVRTHTSIKIKPQEVHDIGLKEVERLSREMDQAMRDSGWTGDRASFFHFLRTDSRFFYKNAEDLLRGYRDIGKRADPQLSRLFGKVPRLQYGVKALPDYAAPTGPQAYYEGGTTEGGRPGWFVANTYDLKSRPKWEMEALSLHEAVPGHHLQLSLAQEIEDMPVFRRYSGSTAFTEGWGLYAESLGSEMGFYKDPYSKIGKITYEMWRACRLVVDTGLHFKGWSRAQAIEFMASRMPKPRHDVEVEVDRYIVWPGQATAYKIGELKFKELKKRAQDRLGDKFDVRAFHDAALGNGGLPLEVLDRLLNEWITAQSK
ncbi:MAG: DUF885 domain-containing protein [Bdellovibrionota bacterium]